MRISSHVLCVPSRLWHLIEELESPQLTILISHRIMKRVGADVPPEPVQASLCGCRPGARHLEHACRHSQSRVRRHHLGTCHPFGKLTPLARRQGRSVFRVLAVYPGRLRAGSVDQGLGCSEMCQEVSVSAQNVELVRCFFFVLECAVRLLNETKMTCAQLTSPP